jgi:asparagine synthase (glutamine-hydrolysing)
MGGIAGIITGNTQRLDPAVASMLRALVHRGPDDEGYERLPLGSDEATGATLGLGYRRLATMDPTAAGRQPIRHPETGDYLAFDGFISGHQALRYRLESLGCVFRGTGDAEVLLHALTMFGEDALGEVDGMFSLAFYHAATRRVLLARDPLGTKPLYVAKGS